jgi:anti-anti-sigma factor
MEIATRIDADGRSAVVSASGDVDLATAGVFRDIALVALRTDPAILAIDLGGVTFMDSAGLGALVHLRREAQTRDVSLRLVSSRRIDATLRISGLDTAFEIHPDLASALGELDDIA